jgi:hypothetical protein
VSDWYLYDAGGAHRGPLSMQQLVQGIRAERIPVDAWVAQEAWFEPAGASGWRRAVDVPEITRMLAALRSGELRVVEGAYKANYSGKPEFGATVMMVGRLPRDGE